MKTILSLLLSLPLSIVTLLMMPSIKTESLFFPRLIFAFPVSIESFLMLMISLPLLPLMVSDFAVELERVILLFFALVLIFALFVSALDIVKLGRLPLLRVNVGLFIFSPVMVMFFLTLTDILLIADSMISVVSFPVFLMLKLSTCDLGILMSPLVFVVEQSFF